MPASVMARFPDTSKYCKFIRLVQIAEKTEFVITSSLPREMSSFVNLVKFLEICFNIKRKNDTELLLSIIDFDKILA